jgi:FAD/FMN-containing dehydrogenase
VTSRTRRVAVTAAVSLVLGLGIEAPELTSGAEGHRSIAREAAERTGPKSSTVNDVTQINRIDVARIAKPTSVEEIQRLVREAKSPVSIGGARHSMGGQIATENALFLDMRDFDDVLVLDVEARTIKVQTGITWRKIQETVDRHDLAVKVMQSYANFTVGGSLSVNGHGRYVGQGSLVSTVREIAVVLADGSLVRASRTENADVFRGAIGGYGAIGVIVEATLDLAPNQPMARESTRMPLVEYKKFFDGKIRDSKTAIFHNADIYPPAYDEVMAITWSATDRPVTIPDRLVPIGGSHLVERLAYLWMSEVPYGKESRARFLDPWRLRGAPVVWRNYEASYDVSELEPVSRTRSTYVLEEYFIPVANFEAFTARMRTIFDRHRPNVINVSIRHASPDADSTMAWAREESFAFVIYYKQGVSAAAQKAVGEWTRELIDAALANGGTYYLPYQLHATREQFRRAYPRAEELFALKRRLDPAYRFRNKLWDKYYDPVGPEAAAPSAGGCAEPAAGPAADAAAIARTADAAPSSDGDVAVRERLRSRPDYARSESQTYLTLPEWYIVYSADELAGFLREAAPSGFPYFRSIGQFWRLYGHVLGATWRTADWGYQAMIAIIGPSFSLEYLFKGLYENTVGRLTELTVPGRWSEGPTVEDRFATTLAGDYAAFMHATPWYEFPFWTRLGDLWGLDGPVDTTALRRAERRGALTGELLFKTAWGGAVAKMSGGAYDPEAAVIHAWVRKSPVAADQRITRREDLGPGDELVALPRYEPFTNVVSGLADQGVRFVEIAGNDAILVQLVAPAAWHDATARGERLVEWPILTDRSRKRVAMTVAVPRLHEVLPSLAAEPGVTIDHIYDF